MTGSDLKAARKARRLTQGDVADRVGISVAYLSRIESGARPLPDHHRCRLLDVLGLDAALPISVDVLDGFSVARFGEVVEVRHIATGRSGCSPPDKALELQRRMLREHKGS